MNNGFTFFRSYYEVAETLNKDQRIDFYDAIFKLAFDGEDPEFEGILKQLFIVIKPNLESSLKKSYWGSLKGSSEASLKGSEEGGLKDTEKASSKAKGKERKGKGKKNIDETSPVYARCMDVYNSFFLKLTNSTPKITSLSGKSLNELIAHCKKMCGENSTDDSVVKKFSGIFDHYDLWDDFNKKQLDLNQISSSINNIIGAIQKRYVSPKKTEPLPTTPSAQDFYGTD